MTAQFITTEGGEELVILSRRAYDELLARLGDEEAEDRVLGAAAQDVLDRVASGQEQVVPLARNHAAAMEKALRKLEQEAPDERS